ncbi:MAG: DsrE/DsrF/TusD sulfur relay family protein [Bacillota bacterium]
MEDASQSLLFILNDAPYGTERPYNGLRAALRVAKRDGVSVRVFMTGDGVLCAKSGQKTPDGYYNVERMIKSLARRGEAAT